MRTVPVVVLVWVVGGAFALAQDKREDERAKKEARKLLYLGDAAFAKKDYKSALLRYQQAYEAFPSAKIFYPMAQTEEKLGLELEALLHYEQLLDEAGNEITAELRGEAKVRISQIEQRLALVRFDVKPPGTRVIVDDVEYGETPLPRPVRLKPGAHKYQLVKDGFKPDSGALELKAGAREQVSKELKSGGGKAPPFVRGKTDGHGAGHGDGVGNGDDGTASSLPPDDSATTSSNEKARPMLYAGIAGTAALGVGTVVMGILAVRKHGIYVDESKPYDVRKDAQDSGQTYAYVTDALLVATVAAGAFTTYWYFYVYNQPNREVSGPTPSARSRPQILPYADGDGGGVLVQGAF